MAEPLAARGPMEDLAPELAPDPGKRGGGMRSAERLLIVLRALNLRNGATVLELNRDTGISRQAIYRILETLRSFGYVRRQDATDRFHLTHLVRRLSAGFDDEEWIVDIAAPVLAELVREVVWPTELAVFSGDAMYLRESTRGRSPFTIDSIAVGQRIPMLLSATGQSYLAFCSDAERAAILATLRNSTDERDRLAHSPEIVARNLETVRAQGWSHADEGFRLHPKTDSVAVPVLVRGHAKAAIALIFIASAASAEQIIDRHLAQLQAAAAEIGERVEALQAEEERRHAAASPEGFGERQ